MSENHNALIFSINNASKNGLKKMKHVLYADRNFTKIELKYKNNYIFSNHRYSWILNIYLHFL